MKKFDIEFEVNQKFSYAMTVEANTPEHAIAIAKNEDFDRSSAKDDCMLESEDDLDTIKVVGERISNDNGVSSHRESFDEPVDGRSEEAKLWDKYNATNGNKCPKCGSEDITGHLFNSNYMHAWRDVDCLDCDETWREFFTMTYIEIL